ncbi:streptomycin 6-kinase [Variovorax boronicumulans]|uniref:aminoglycoside phosphotransferase family protein n=1 Tax=Variovorax boronicumulans TaxID=436515 RepID=UPI00277E4F7E|nr:aminoglycoside phosphotransferase family protein [Variovorax boronicumulans]MDP9910724.1 streptomycin 6-kinase [Variovorax boronicumulans]
MFAPFLERWHLTPDGEAFTSLSGTLLPVRQQGVAAMLKISHEAEEQAGNLLMAWWNGDGAAPVLAHDSEALLMVRAQGTGSLPQMVQDGHDDEATRILCAAAARLHAPRDTPPPPTLVPLARWFEALWAGAATHGGVFGHSARTARELLAAPRDVVVLHGESALVPGRFARRIEVIAEATGIERLRLLQWVLAWAGLSSVWMLEDGEAPGSTLEVAKLAAAALGIAG